MGTISTIAPSAFQITQIGINAAALAGKQGISLSIAKFVLATGNGYTPSLSDINYHGTSVYNGVPSSWNMLSDTSRDIVCVVPAAAGPFTYGEIALFLDDGTLFALAVFQDLQTKASTASGVANALTFHCVLNFGASPSVIQVITGTPGAIEVLGSTNNVTGQAYLPGKPTALIVMEPVNGNSSLFLTAANGTQWNVAGYLQVDSGTVTAVNNNGISLDSTAFNVIDPNFIPGDFLIQDMNGNVRVVTGGYPGTAHLTYPISSMSVGQVVMLLAREITVSDYVALEVMIEQKDANQTYALNSAIEQVNAVLNQAITGVTTTLASEKAILDADIAAAVNTLNGYILANEAEVDADIAAMQLEFGTELASLQAAVATVGKQVGPMGPAGATGPAGSSISVYTSPPSNPILGTLWWDSGTTGSGFIWDGNEWVEFCPSGGGGGAAISVGTTPPAGAAIGTLWWDSGTTGKGFIWDGSEWVIFTPGGGGAVGATGATGPAGLAGQAGPAGATGPTGAGGSTKTLVATVDLPVNAWTKVCANQGGPIVWYVNYSVSNNGSWLEALEIHLGYYGDTHDIYAATSAAVGSSGIQSLNISFYVLS